MGRSVSTHRNAVATVYLQPEFEEGDDFAFDDFLDDLKDNVLLPRYKAAAPCDRWVDREDHVVLESQTYEISVSEYCGLVAVCLAPLDVDNGLHRASAERMADGFRKHLEKCFPGSALRSIGRFSNGEQVFQRA
jgi:hypothetical protein